MNCGAANMPTTTIWTPDGKEPCTSGVIRPELYQPTATVGRGAPTVVVINRSPIAAAISKRFLCNSLGNGERRASVKLKVLEVLMNRTVQMVKSAIPAMALGAL